MTVYCLPDFLTSLETFVSDKSGTYKTMKTDIQELLIQNNNIQFYQTNGDPQILYFSGHRLFKR